MKLRNLSVLLFAAACGGGGKDNPTPIDSPPSDGGGFFPNSRNDVFSIVFSQADGLVPSLTPDTGDAPDNDVAFAIAETGGTGIHGEMGIAGDDSDSYEERDTFELATGATVNQLTIRMDWPAGVADMDYALMEVPADGATEFPFIGSGTAVSNDLPEFATFTVDPGTNYLLWGGVFEELAGGGAPSLPAQYDLSVYGASVTTANFGGANCDYTEASDNNNNSIKRFSGTGAVGTRENTNLTATGTKSFCGTLNTGHAIIPDAAPNDMFGTEEVDTFSLNFPLEGDFIITVIGQTEADQTKINTLIANGSLQAGVVNDPCLLGAGCPDVDPNTAGTQIRLDQFFGLASHTGTHGVDAFFARASTFENPNTAGDIQGPKGVAIFVRAAVADSPVLTDTIKYRIVVSEDPHDTRAPKKTGDKTEMNDN